MSMTRVANQMRLAAALARGDVGKPKQGLVSSYDPDRYAVKVRLQPEDIETGWLPIEVLQAGAAFGIYAAPAVGDLAIVLFLEANREVGWCAGFLPNDQDRPPKVLTGEIHAIHKSGAFLKFLTDGTVHLEATAGILSKGPWSHQGTLHVTDDVTVDKTLTAATDVVGGGKHLKTHVHSGVTAGAANTGQPA